MPHVIENVQKAMEEILGAGSRGPTRWLGHASQVKPASETPRTADQARPGPRAAHSQQSYIDKVMFYLSTWLLSLRAHPHCKLRIRDDFLRHRVRHRRGRDWLLLRGYTGISPLNPAKLLHADDVLPAEETVEPNDG